MNFYTSISNSKKLIKLFLYINICIIFIVFTINIFINPYSEAIIKIKNLNSKMIVNPSTKEKLGFLKDIDFDSFVIGSSQSSRFYAKDLNNITNTKWITYPIATSMSSEHYYYIHYIKSIKKLKNIFYIIDDYNLYGKYNFRGDTISSNLEDYNIWDYFTLDTLIKSIQKLKYNTEHINNSTQILSIFDKYFNGWDNRELTEEELIKHMNTKPIGNMIISNRERKYLEMIANENKKELIPIAAFYHPYILLMKGRTNYEQYFKTILMYFENFWFINTKYLNETLKSEYYYDSTHTNNKFAIRVINSVFGYDDFFIKLDSNNYQKILDEIYKFACNQDFSKFKYYSLVKCKF